MAVQAALLAVVCLAEQAVDDSKIWTTLLSDNSSTADSVYLHCYSKLFPAWTDAIGVFG
jgi:hypothetical protein